MSRMSRLFSGLGYAVIPPVPTREDAARARSPWRTMRAACCEPRRSLPPPWPASSGLSCISIGDMNIRGR
jgi:hypothetical protein